MKKASVFLLLTVVLLAVVASVSADAAWVTHYPEEGICTLGWFDASYNLVLIEGQGTQVFTNSTTGVSSITCHTFIDFDDPNLLGIEEVCMILPNACYGNGNLAKATYETTGGLVCTVGGISTTDYMQIVTRNGFAEINCHINPSSN